MRMWNVDQVVGQIIIHALLLCKNISSNARESEALFWFASRLSIIFQQTESFLLCPTLRVDY